MLKLSFYIWEKRWSLIFILIVIFYVSKLNISITIGYDNHISNQSSTKIENKITSSIEYVQTFSDSTNIPTSFLLSWIVEKNIDINNHNLINESLNSFKNSISTTPFSHLFRLQKDNYKQWIFGLSTMGLFSHEKANSYVQIIEENHFYKYDSK